MSDHDLILFLAIFAYILFLIAVFFVSVHFSRKRAMKEEQEKEKERDWLTKEEAEAFTGENGAYFLNKWKDRPDSVLKGWNWAAAFFFVEWLAYRKMYFFSAGMLLGPWFGFPYRKFPIAILFYWFFSRFLDVRLAILVSILTAKFLIGGLVGNMWYRDQALKALKESLHLSEPDRLAYLKFKGGTNAIAPVIAVVIQAMLIVALIYVSPLFSS